MSAENNAKLVLFGSGLFLVVISLSIYFSDAVIHLLLELVSVIKSKPFSLHWIGKLHEIAIESIIKGIGLILTGWLVIPRLAQFYSFFKNQRNLIIISIIAIFLIYLPLIILEHSATIAGERYWWLDDDAMISMRYAHNLADGQGLVWNPGEKIEGYSNFLWTIYMAFIHLMPISMSKISLLVLLTNIMITIGTIILAIKFVPLIGGGRLATLVTLFGLIINKNIIIWTISGLETALLTFLFLLAIWRLLQDAEENEPRFITFVFIAILSLVRADALILSGLLFMFALVLFKNRKKIILYTILSLILPLAHEIFRIYYYHDILPNTAYLKTTGWPGKYFAGFKYVLESYIVYGFFIISSMIGSMFLRKKNHKFLLILFFSYSVYIIYTGGDAFGDFRFFVPVLPILIALTFVNIGNFNKQSPILFVISVIILATMPTIIRVYSDLQPKTFDIENIKMGILLKKNTPDTTRIADICAGSVFYFSERYGIDFLGRMDRHIARLPVASNGTVPGHNKFDYDYSISKMKPDIVIANFKWPIQKNQVYQFSSGDWAFTGQLYLNPIFQQHCLPYPITSVETWRTIFVCDWSPLLAQKDKWQSFPQK